MVISFSKKRVILIKTEEFVLQDISIKDDALHKFPLFGQIETWYYDSMLSDGYSIVLLLNVFTFLKAGFVLTGLYIYKDKELLKSVRKRYHLKRFKGSLENPNIKINNKEIIFGQVDSRTKKWNYHLCLKEKELGIDLFLEKNCKAWLGETFLGKWLVIPKFKVNGSIFINDKEIKVSGEGYHDHNTYPIYAPFINKGYDFGKIRCEFCDIIWANVTRNKNDNEIIVVLNQEDSSQVIPSKNVKFTVEKSTLDNRKNIPTKYHLEIDYEKLNADLHVQSINFHNIKIPTVNYWRHHVKNTGNISYISNMQKIENIEIIEQLRFL